VCLGGVCHASELSKNGSTDRAHVYTGDRSRPVQHRIRLGSRSPPQKGVIGQIGDFGYLILVIGKSWSRPSAPVRLVGSSSSLHRRQVLNPCNIVLDFGPHRRKWRSYGAIRGVWLPYFGLATSVLL
jgi:hypothetical protein